MHNKISPSLIYKQQNFKLLTLQITLQTVHQKRFKNFFCLKLAKQQERKCKTQQKGSIYYLMSQNSQKQTETFLRCSILNTQN